MQRLYDCLLPWWELVLSCKTYKNYQNHIIVQASGVAHEFSLLNFQVRLLAPEQTFKSVLFFFFCFFSTILNIVMLEPNSQLIYHFWSAQMYLVLMLRIYLFRPCVNLNYTFDTPSFVQNFHCLSKKIKNNVSRDTNLLTHAHGLTNVLIGYFFVYLFF